MYVLCIKIYQTDNLIPSFTNTKHLKFSKAKEKFTFWMKSKNLHICILHEAVPPRCSCSPLGESHGEWELSHYLFLLYFSKTGKSLKASSSYSMHTNFIAMN